MKRFLFLLLCLPILFGCRQHLRTPEELGLGLFKSLQQGREDRFLGCCLQEVDITFLDNKIRVSRPENPDDYSPLADLIPELPQGYGEMYDSLRACSFDWASATLTDMEAGDMVAADWVPPGVVMLDSLTLFMEDGTLSVSLRFYDIVRTPRD